jgi:glycosyltransferase involved in cell wall biosynthesis
MQIARIVPLTEAIPPKLYGGTERVISWLTDELVALGHEVVLFASGDSQTSAHLEACWPKRLLMPQPVRPAYFAFLGPMTCGTPVIAFNRGSVPEIVEDGLTGFVVEGEGGGCCRHRPTTLALSRRHSTALRGAVHGATDGARISRPSTAAS